VICVFHYEQGLGFRLLMTLVFIVVSFHSLSFDYCMGVGRGGVGVDKCAQKGHIHSYGFASHHMDLHGYLTILSSSEEVDFLKRQITQKNAACSLRYPCLPFLHFRCCVLHVRLSHTPSSKVLRSHFLHFSNQCNTNF
jgi:hypothetical protein